MSSTTTDEGLTYTSHTSGVRPGDEAQVLAGAPSSLPGGMGDLLHVVGVLVDRVKAIEDKLGITVPEVTSESLADSGLTTEPTNPSVRAGDEAQTSWQDPATLPPPAPVAEPVPVDPTKDPEPVPLGGTGAGTGDASQPAEEDREAAIARMPDWAQDLIHRGEGLIGGV